MTAMTMATGDEVHNDGDRAMDDGAMGDDDDDDWDRRRQRCIYYEFILIINYVNSYSNAII